MTSSSVVEPLIVVSLTHFLDFAAAKDAPARRTVVRKAKKQIAEGYSPERDLYKVTRDAIRSAKGQKVNISALSFSTNHGATQQKVVEGFNTFVRSKAFKAKLVKRKEWVYGDLVVSVNPEIALELDGITTYYKLYFKAEALTKRAAQPLYQLLVEMLEPETHEDIGILELRKAKVIAKPSLLPDPDLAASLRADALSFVTL